MVVVKEVLLNVGTTSQDVDVRIIKNNFYDVTSGDSCGVAAAFITAEASVSCPEPMPGQRILIVQATAGSTASDIQLADITVKMLSLVHIRELKSSCVINFANFANCLT